MHELMYDLASPIIKPQPTSSGGLKTFNDKPYGSQPSTTLFQQYYTTTGSGGSSGNAATTHYKSLNRLPATVITGEYKKRTALVSPYQNRSIWYVYLCIWFMYISTYLNAILGIVICSSSIGLDDFPTGGLKSMRNSQNSGTLYYCY